MQMRSGKTKNKIFIIPTNKEHHDVGFLQSGTGCHTSQQSQHDRSHHIFSPRGDQQFLELATTFANLLIACLLCVLAATVVLVL